MKKSAFELLKNMEASWWYQGRAQAVEAAFSKVRQPPMTSLDYGAGFGGMYPTLARHAQEVYAFEPDQEAGEACTRRGYAGAFKTEEEAFARSYDCICLFDVLEHLEKDTDFLARAKRALSPGGVMLFTVPAFPFLWSAHDIEHHHFRRYRRSRLVQLLTEAGYSVRFASYWNMTLFFPAALLRLLGKTGEGGLDLPRPLNALFAFITNIEALLMRIMPLPFGTGIVVLAKKETE